MSSSTKHSKKEEVNDDDAVRLELKTDVTVDADSEPHGTPRHSSRQKRGCKVPDCECSTFLTQPDSALCTACGHHKADHVHLKGRHHGEDDDDYDSAEEYGTDKADDSCTRPMKTGCIFACLLVAGAWIALMVLYFQETSSCEPNLNCIVTSISTRCCDDSSPCTDSTSLYDFKWCRAMDGADREVNPVSAECDNLNDTLCRAIVDDRYSNLFRTCGNSFGFRLSQFVPCCTSSVPTCSASYAGEIDIPAEKHAQLSASSNVLWAISIGGGLLVFCCGCVGSWIIGRELIDLYEDYKRPKTPSRKTKSTKRNKAKKSQTTRGAAMSPAAGTVGVDRSRITRSKTNRS